MGLDIPKLYSAGRAKSPTELWSNEEHEALVALSQQRNLERTIAADFVRNGVLTVEDYDKAVKANFKPEKLDDAVKKATDGLKDNAKGLKGKKK